MSQESSTPSVLERILAYATITIIGAALLSFFATLIIGLTDRQALASGMWPFVYGLSMFGLPLGFALLVVLLVVNQRRRRAEFKRNAAQR